MIRGWWAAMVLMGVWTTGAGREMARIKHQNDFELTSSTLEWVDVEENQTPPPNALLTSEGGGAWCRFAHHGKVAGVVQDGICHAPSFGRVVISPVYETLVSVNDSARVVEVEWSRPTALSSGGVLVFKKRILGLARTEEGQVLPGFVDTSRRRAYVVNGSEALLLDEAVILTEVEPENYSLTGVTWNEDRAQLLPKDRVLYNFTLQNPAAEASEVARDVEYTVREEVYWGNVRGTVKGITATVTDPSGRVKDITWGDINDFERVEEQKVALQVPAGASVEVQLVGVMHKYEAPYTGQLTAVYRDGEQRSRTITGLHHHLYLAELRADYSRPRYLESGEEMVGDFPTSEVLIASTTTTTTTTTTTPSPSTAASSQQAGSLATPEINPAPALPALPHPLLTCCFALLLQRARAHP